ncbi:MAG: YiiX/YebB-like N1pC/P60 family cysteine hydrolase [Casimicrobium sp.]
MKLCIVPRVLFTIVCVSGIAGCATDVQLDPRQGASGIQVQNKSLNPSNGGELVSERDLRMGDLILSAANGINSVGIRTLTLSPVSHAAIYVGNGQIIEAVGAGVGQRSVQAFIAEEATIVAFRHPKLDDTQAELVRKFAEKNIGTKYNTAGVVLQAPFALQRKFCELPVMSAIVRDACIRGSAAITLGPVPNDQFFCSQFVLEAYKAAGLPLTDSDPRLVTPGDLLHMREGDVPSIKIHQTLQYVGHLKAPTALASAADIKR